MGDTELCIPVRCDEADVDRFIRFLHDELIFDMLHIRIDARVETEWDAKTGEHRLSNPRRLRVSLNEDRIYNHKYKINKKLVITIVSVTLELLKQLNMKIVKRSLIGKIDGAQDICGFRLWLGKETMITFAEMLEGEIVPYDGYPDKVIVAKMRNGEKIKLLQSPRVGKCVEQLIYDDINAGFTRKDDVEDLLNKMEIEMGDYFEGGFIKVYTSEEYRESIINALLKKYDHLYLKQNEDLYKYYSHCEIVDSPGCTSKEDIYVVDDGFVVEVGCIDMTVYGHDVPDCGFVDDYFYMILDSITSLPKRKYGKIKYEGAVAFIYTNGCREHLIFGNVRDYTYTKDRVLKELK